MSATRCTSFRIAAPCVCRSVSNMPPRSNDIVQQLRGDGFTRANTIASELKSLERGRAHWDKNTVLIVDEAAMISTANLRH